MFQEKPPDTVSNKFMKRVKIGEGHETKSNILQQQTYHSVLGNYLQQKDMWYLFMRKYTEINTAGAILF